MKRNKKECSICKQPISLSNFKSHIQSCERRKNKVVKNDGFSIIEGNKCKCNYCDRIFHIKGIYTHIWRSHTEVGKKFISTPKGTIVAWNKGLSKETNDSLKKMGQSISKTTKGKPGKPLSESHKKKLSEMLKKRYKDNPELHPNRILAGNRNKWTYPEKVAADWFDIHNINFEYNKKIDRFYPDFTIDKLIIEIDGEQFHQDKEYDQNRDKILTDLGYTIIRINSKEKIEDKLKQIFSEWVKG